MIFQLKKDCNPIEFLKAVSQYEEPVYYETAEGDCLDLHSAFCQYIFGSLIRQTDNPISGFIRFEHEVNPLSWASYLEEANER